MEEFDGPPGTVVVLPPNVWRNWVNISEEPGHVFATVTPGGFEGLFIAIEATGANTPAKIAVIEARFGIVKEEIEKLAAPK